MTIEDIDALTATLDGIHRTTSEGRQEWRYRGRLIARQLDDSHIVIRSDFAYRDTMLNEFPDTFSVPSRYRKHMMIVADLAGGDQAAIGDAIEMAWELQRRGG